MSLAIHASWRCCCVLASFAGSAQAVEFDEKLKAPMVKDAAVLRSQAQSYSASFARSRTRRRAEIVTNRASGSERFDLSWQIQQAIEARAPAG